MRSTAAAMKPNTYVGQPVERVEDARLLRGRGSFVADIAPAGMLHAAIVRSAVAHGHLRRIDSESASLLPGVRAIFTAADLANPIPTIPVRLAPIKGLERFVQPVIATGKVRFVGEPLAVVVADSRELAEDAMETIRLEIEELPPITDHAGSDRGAPLLFETNGTNIAAHYVATVGDPDAAFAAADYVRRERFRSQRHTALPLETRGVLAEFDAATGRLAVSGACKVPYYNRRLLAGMLGIDEHSIDMIEGDVGGGFGVRGEFYPEDFLIPFAAMRLARPVRWIEDRREHLISSNHSREIDCDLEIACRRDGTLIGLRGHVQADMGAYIRTNAGVVPAKAGQFLIGPYRFPHVRVEVTAAVTNKTPTGTYRAPGRVEANFFRERLMDMVAQDLGIDPLELRRKNLIGADELPYSIGALVPYEHEAHYDSGDYHAALDRCLEEFGWEDKRALQGRMIDGRCHGIAVTCFVQSGGGGPPENARLSVAADGTIDLGIGSSSLGQGIETTFTQVTADALGVPFESIRVRHGSTGLVSNGSGSYHSRTAIMGGSAILDAAEKLLPLIRDAGARQLDCRPQDAELRDGCAVAAGDRTVTLAQLGARAIADGHPLTAEGTFAKGKNTWSNGAQAAHVAVDPKTGQVEVLDCIVVEDVGRLINPHIVHGQAIGALVQGLGGVFLDHVLYDGEGQMLNASLADYLVPTATDFPRVRAVATELSPSPSNPLGVKGGSEGGNVATAATIGNAVAAALAQWGVQPTELPLSPPRIWELIARARRDASTGDEEQTR
jgi:aerobic carbon-monoxide dehydrogenase large subunit